MKSSAPDFAQILREGGFKATPGRIQLLSVLWKESKPLAVSTIQKHLRALNEVTLYRALEALAAKGIIRQVDLGHSHAHFEFEKKHHHHLVCTDCGEVEDVVGCGMEKIENKILEQSRRFSVMSSHSLEFFGTCTSCAKQ